MVLGMAAEGNDSLDGDSRGKQGGALGSGWEERMSKRGLGHKIRGVEQGESFF